MFLFSYVGLCTLGGDVYIQNRQRAVATLLLVDFYRVLCAKVVGATSSDGCVVD